MSGPIPSLGGTWWPPARSPPALLCCSRSPMRLCSTMTSWPQDVTIASGQRRMGSKCCAAVDPSSPDTAAGGNRLRHGAEATNGSVRHLWRPHPGYLPLQSGLLPGRFGGGSGACHRRLHSCLQHSVPHAENTCVQWAELTRLLWKYITLFQIYNPCNVLSFVQGGEGCAGH